MSLLAYYYRRRRLALNKWKVYGDYYFNCGGNSYLDEDGTTWHGLGGQSYDYGEASSSSPLWRTVIYGAGTYFSVPLPPGNYELTAYIKEVYQPTPGMRTSGLRVANGPLMYEAADGFVGPGLADDRDPNVLAGAQPISVGANGLTLQLLGAQDTPIICALSFYRL